MKQLTQTLRNGALEILDVSKPCIGRGRVLVQNHYSLISAGTEGATVSTARKSLIGKARERPAQVKQVVDALRQQGVVQTYRAVTKRLDAYSPLGYSSAGVVVAVASDVRGFAVGDKVACAGAGYANHAEFVSVPANLCVKLRSDAELPNAAYNTLGAIAMQGVRQADLRLGETCVVIGLGLLGQLTCLILRAGGIRVIGVDINDHAVRTASEHCADHAFRLDDPGLVSAVNRVSHGIGADAAIITAATDSTAPVNVAGRLLRHRGTVIVVGNVPTGFDREPDYYRKELNLKMSCSYGPGRYDLQYEEKGYDYPPGFVRWTENRNMQAFQELLYSRQIDVGYITTHRYSIDEAPTAYDLILSRHEPFLGVLLQYDVNEQVDKGKVWIGEGLPKPAEHGLNVGFVGAGSYAQSFLLPNLAKFRDVRLTGVATGSGTSSRSVADKFRFSYTASAPSDIIKDDATGTVFIATRHDSHATYVLEALTAGKNVFVEKPLCLNADELHAICAAWLIHRPLVMVGFNRRFSPLAARAKEAMGHGPMCMLYRVNAGSIPKDSWIQDPDLGGGRLIGEACHFVDFMSFMCGAKPVRVFASGLSDPSNLEDCVTVSLQFANGSVGSLCYFANGSPKLKKEYVEVYKDGMVVRIEDFVGLEVSSKARSSRTRLFTQDKGQRDMIKALVKALEIKSDCPIRFSDAISATAATFAIVESLRTGLPVDVIEPDAAGAHDASIR